MYKQFSGQVIVFINFILSLDCLMGVGGGGEIIRVILVQVCSEIAKTPQCIIIAIKGNMNLLFITFSTSLIPLARVVSRNDASPSDGENKKLVCVRGDQCHDHIKDIRKKSSYRLMPVQGPLLHSPKRE